MVLGFFFSQCKKKIKSLKASRMHMVDLSGVDRHNVAEKKTKEANTCISKI